MNAATGPWRYDAPPTVNYLLLMKIRAIGSPCISLYFSKEISRWFVQSVGFVSAKDIICWAEINMPESWEESLG